MYYKRENRIIKCSIKTRDGRRRKIETTNTKHRKLTNMLKVQRWRKTYHANTNQKQADLPFMNFRQSRLQGRYYGIRKKEKVKVKLLSHVQLCDPVDCSLSGYSVHGIFQARDKKGH